MRKAVIVSYYKYPEGDAGAVRQHIFAKLYKELGYEVTVIGMGESTDFALREYDGVGYISFRHTGAAAKALNILGYKKRLKAFLSREKGVELIQVVDPPPAALAYVKKYAEANKIKLLHDSVEWYSPEQFKAGKFDIGYIIKNLYNTRWIDKSFSVLAISSYLEKHFSSRGIKAIRVPVLADFSKANEVIKRTTPQKTVFLYAGSPGKKDYLAEILSGFALLGDDELKRAEIRLFGVTREQLVSLCGVDEGALSRLSDSLNALGRVSRLSVIENLAEADFTVLMRPEDMRYAKAGFPTKVVESLSNATPVIANITSDLGMYLNSQNSITVADCSPQAFSEAAGAALKMTYEQRSNMCRAAFVSAKESFDYKGYIEKISQWLGED